MNATFYSKDIIIDTRLLFPAALNGATCYEDRIVRHMIVKFLEGHCLTVNQVIHSSYLPRGFLANNVNLFIKDAECWEGDWV